VQYGARSDDNDTVYIQPKSELIWPKTVIHRRVIPHTAVGNLAGIVCLRR